MDYKYLIVGAGISGLYAAYLLHKELKEDKIFVIEKTKYLGGRVKSKNIGFTTIELGAGVIPSIHHNIINLVNELGLKDTLSGGKSTRSYFNLEEKTITPLIETNFYNILIELKNRIDKNEIPMELATSYNLYRLIERFYGVPTADKLRYEFGYDGDFEYQNAYNALLMFTTSFDPETEYNTMKGGLSQIIEGLRQYLINNSIDIKLKTECINIRKEENKYECILQNNKRITSENIIFAIPKLDLFKIRYLNDIKYSLLNSVLTKPFMRIYAVFPIENGNPWFSHLGTTTTDTILRQIIPMDKDHGLLMVYVDDGAAKSWYYLKRKKYLKKELLFHLRRVFTGVNIPKPIKVYAHYCNTATHVWKPTYNSDKLNKKILKPYENENIYIIGEAYSKTQEWMEGAVTSAVKLIDLLKKDEKYNY
jgi:hypothetical protein